MVHIPGKGVKPGCHITNMILVAILSSIWQYTNSIYQYLGKFICWKVW